jgi:glycosyltransferase involved in cell wall biosynthesis
MLNKIFKNKKMHIVFTIADNGAVPYFKWFAEKAKQEEKHKFSFIVLSNQPTKMLDDVKRLGCDTYWIKFNASNRKADMVSVFFKAYKLLRKLKPDVVQTNLFDDSLPVLLAARNLRIKKRIIVKQDTTFHYYYAKKWVKADRFNNRNATDLVPVSNEAKEFIIEKEKADVNKITMIHHGIPSSLFTSSTEENRNILIDKYCLKDKIVIGTVSRLIEWKGYRYIIEAAKTIVKKHPNAIFMFVGEGNQKEELIDLAKKQNVLEHIIFTGWMERKLIPSFYSLLNVYAHAASFEPFGFVIPEAMMNAAPVVSTPTGSALDVVKHKENGYLCKYKDVKSLADGILYTIEKGNEFKEKGKQAALKIYEFDVMFENYLRLYEKKS